MPGKIANNANGRASPIEKPNIPKAGPPIPPLPAITKREPTIGPVHEKETITNVNAIKNMPPKLETLALLSVTFVHEEGNVISKAPKNDIPNIIKMIKNIRLAIQLVERLFNAVAPNANDIRTPKIVNIVTIDNE